RSAEGHPERLPALMQEMVAQNVDVIVTTGSAGVRAARAATDRIPIVAAVTNILDIGVIDNLAKPGGNVTGIGGYSPGVMARELQFLKQAAPKISRVAAITFPDPPERPSKWRDELERAARELRLQLVWAYASRPEDLEAAFATVVRERADALYVGGNH